MPQGGLTNSIMETCADMALKDDTSLTRTTREAVRRWLAVRERRTLNDGPRSNGSAFPGMLSISTRFTTKP